ncbi:MAG TPA: IclR family transcriptional regulator, partial [Eubacteriaceae bacterium]|nr:IclR family transcriptional regulator [Eubacteriaceae bacterium]
MANPQGVIIQSVSRALDILQCFEGNNKELGISEIANSLMLSKSTIYGLVNTLLSGGDLEQNKENKKYRLGIRLFELGSLVQRRMDLRNEARLYCLELAENYSYTIHLATHYNGEIVYIDKVDMPGAVIVYSQVGKRAPMHCTGVGKAMLAYLPPS